jgi:hypothetical protein
MMKEAAAEAVKLAYYLTLKDAFVGICYTGEGPQLLFNHETYNLNEGHWDVELVIGKETNLLTLYWNGVAKVSVRCEHHSDFCFELYDLLCEKKAVA